jgi:hypothetical protein
MSTGFKKMVTDMSKVSASKMFGCTFGRIRIGYGYHDKVVSFNVGALLKRFWDSSSGTACG